MFSAFPRGPGGFRKLWEARRNHHHLSWYLLVPGITSSGQKQCFFVPSTVYKAIQGPSEGYTRHLQELCKAT